MQGRTKEEIFADVLAAAQGGATMTEIMFRTYLSYSQVRDLISILLAERYLEKLDRDSKFVTTAEGLQYLQRADLRGKSEASCCSHQCQKCGILYGCDEPAGCERPFGYGTCSPCRTYKLRSGFQDFSIGVTE